MHCIPEYSIRLCRLQHLLCSTFLLLLCAFSATAADSPLIAYAESSSLDSRVIETGDGSRVEGYASDLLRSLLSKTGRTVDIRVVPWPRLMYFLESEANVLAYNMTRTPERENRFHWIGEIRPVNFSLYGLRDRIQELPDSLEEARDLKVGAYRNDVVEQYLLNIGFSNIVHITENYNLMAMMQRQRLDLIPYSRVGMQDLISQAEEMRNELIPVIALPEISTAHYLVMSLNSDPELVEELQAAYQSMVDSGEYAEIMGASLLP